MADQALKPEQLLQIDYRPPQKDWRDPKVEFRKGVFCYSALAKNLEYLGLPNPRKWQPFDADWKLPPNWKEIILEGMRERLEKYRSFRLFMDICVRCGACADKCHFYQCTECRRCSVFCPYGIDTAEVTMIGRELLNLVGCNINWVLEPAANCFRTGNHLGVQPHGFKDSIDFAVDELAEITGVRVEAPIMKKGAEVLFVVPSADYFGTPHYYSLLGYLMILHEIGLDYTFSAFVSEGGNFGLFNSHEMIKRLNAKMYAEAKRLKVKWILGAECGHMWRVLHQYMDTMNGPADFLEVPLSPVTGTRFENARSTKMIHICEFTADLIHHGKLKLDPSRNDHWNVTFHDSCNPSRAMGLLEEPRSILRSVCNQFHEMPENTIREQTFCCGSGSGLGTDENLEMRLRGGFPRANAVKYVRDKYGVNVLACICAIDKAVLPPLLEYWVPGVDVAGVHELVGNALVMKGEKERPTDLRGTPLKMKEAAAHA